MTLWFYVKTNEDPKAVGDVVCAFNFMQGQHPEDKYSWIIEVGKNEPGYWEIKGKYAALKDVTIICIVYRIGDTVAFADLFHGVPHVVQLRMITAEPHHDEGRVLAVAQHAAVLPYVG